jgi:hypothetical protein
MSANTARAFKSPFFVLHPPTPLKNHVWFLDNCTNACCSFPMLYTRLGAISNFLLKPPLTLTPLVFTSTFCQTGRCFANPNGFSASFCSFSLCGDTSSTEGWESPSTTGWDSSSLPLSSSVGGGVEDDNISETSVTSAFDRSNGPKTKAQRTKNKFHFTPGKTNTFHPTSGQKRLRIFIISHHHNQESQ